MNDAWRVAIDRVNSGRSVRARGVASTWDGYTDGERDTQAVDVSTPPTHPFDSLRMLHIAAATAVAAVLGWSSFRR